MSEFTDGARLVKICGVTSASDAVLVRDAGADALGLIFATSKRRVDPDLARDIVAASEGVIHVGVFRDNEDDFILRTVDASGVDVVQIHGVLSGALLDQLRRRGLGVIKALAIGSDEFLTFDESLVDAVLVDGLEPGSGLAHSWEALGARHFCVPLIAAGGLNAENVGEVIERVRPWGVDVATGVEASPGVKDQGQVTKFVQMATSTLSRRG